MTSLPNAPSAPPIPPQATSIQQHFAIHPASLSTGKPLMTPSKQDPVISNILGHGQTPAASLQQSVPMPEIMNLLMLQQQQINNMMEKQKTKEKDEEQAKIQSLQVQLESLKESLKAANEHQASREGMDKMILSLLMNKQDTPSTTKNEIAPTIPQTNSSYQVPSASTQMLTTKEVVNSSTSPRPPSTDDNRCVSPEIIMPRSFAEQPPSHAVVPPISPTESQKSFTSTTTTDEATIICADRTPFYEPKLDQDVGGGSLPNRVRSVSDTEYIVPRDRIPSSSSSVDVTLGDVVEENNRAPPEIPTVIPATPTSPDDVIRPRLGENPAPVISSEPRTPEVALSLIHI